MKLKLYSTGCPKCKILEVKLKNKNLEYSTTSDMEDLPEEIKSVPVLAVLDEDKSREDKRATLQFLEYWDALLFIDSYQNNNL